MDFKTVVNKESFKAILLHHLKSQVRAKYGHTVSNKIQESLEKETLSCDNIISSVSRDILEAPDFSKFASSFLEDIDILFEDKKKYIPKQEKHRNSSQCSSASSVNASTIDFLSPDQFQSVTQSLANGTNAEKLEALGLLCRLPTLEHLTHHILWIDVESGLHNALSSPIIFLKAQSLRFYVKMLTCAEPKVVLESYQSLIKYFLEVLLPSVHEIGMDQIRCRCAVEIISILNKFLQSISTHWLRYPQSMIENITIQSLSILPSSGNSGNFPVWMCIALCDTEAKWLKSILHGHISRGSLLKALRENLDILSFVVDMCDKFCSDENSLTLDETCCQKPYFVTEITHALCFLAHLLEYFEGRQILNVYLSWTSILCTVMNCVCKLCNTACFSCCSVVCDVVSKKWLYFWGDEDKNANNEHLVHILASNLDKEDASLNTLYFTMRCFGESYGGMDNIAHFLDLQSNIDDLLLKLLKKGLELSFDGEENFFAVINIFNSSLVLLKEVCATPSTLFTNCDFIQILSKWLLKVKEFNGINSTSLNSDLLQKEKLNIILETNKNALNVLISFLNKPIRSTLFPDDSIYETSLNILLEKILGDIKSGNSVCPLDTSVLSRSLNRSTGTKFVLSRTFIFRLSSIIWQLKDKYNDSDDLQSMKFILEALLPSIFPDLPLLEASDETNVISESYILQHVLLYPNKPFKNVEAEDHCILSLQIISLLCTSIHSLCLLENDFKLSELILKQQSKHLMIDDKKVIDPISLLQNHILVKLYTLGGPGERNLPCEMLEGINDDYVWPFVKEYPIPEIFLNLVSSTEEFNDTLFSDVSEIEDLKCTFLSLTRSERKLSPSLVFHLLENSINILQSEINFLNITEFIALDVSDCMLHETELVGLEMVKRYGIHLNLIPLSDDEELERLLKATKSLLKSTDSKRLDIFVCSVYLMCRGNIDIAWPFLQSFSKCKASLFVWKEYLVYVSQNCSNSWVTLQSTMYELCDLIVKEALPQLFSALQFQGILPSVIFDYWSSQCYWNYLDFAEISYFILLNVLFSGEFSLYFFVAILKHLCWFILENAHNCELFSMLIKNPIKGFVLCNYTDYLMELSHKFHLTISKQIKNVLH